MKSVYGGYSIMITVDGNWIMEGLQTYIVIRSFRRKKNKKNEEYGWAVADYTLSENLYGKDYVRSAYNMSAQKAREKIIEHLLNMHPYTKKEEAEQLIKY